MNDHELLVRTATRDERAFRVLWNRHSAWLWRVARPFCDTDDEADATTLPTEFDERVA